MQILISVLLLAAGLCLLGANNLSLFDWDEINFAEISREMAETGNYLQPTINYAPFHEKPPLFSWMQLASYEVFGVTPLGARFPNLICGLVSFLTLLRLGRHSLGPGAIYWPLFLTLSLLPALYFQSGIIDPWFNLFIFLGLWPALAGRPATWPGALLSGLFLGLAVLTKGPVALLIAGICWVVLLVARRDGRAQRMGHYLVAGLLALALIGIWLAFLWERDGSYFATEFLRYQWRLFLREDAGHGGFPGYHAIVLLLGCFPAAWVALPALFRRRDYALPADGGMRILFWTVLILFSIVNTKIVHYSSLCYFPLAWLAARTFTGKELTGNWSGIVRYGLGGTWALYTLIALAVPTAAIFLEDWSGRITNPELLSRLALPVAWPWYTFLPALIGLAGVVWGLYSRGKGRTTSLPAGTTHPLRTRVSAHLLLTPLLLLTSLYTIAPRVQAYSQGAPVTFFSELAGRDVYLGTAYYKSYAHWFYGRVAPERYADGCRERQCRFHEPIAKPLYFAGPIRKTEQILREVPDAVLLEQRGGFSFFLREKNAD